ncbi:KA1 domain/Ssp2 C-terminal domain-containing protein [Entophlyctis helioformis]|nr:KA1 domain/Ssp2 C-terminal domain-containing protein [Entophlyctis helioformis]
MNDGDFLKTSCGSPNYAAPEVISGKLYAGPEIDIWSTGVILYVMLCGRLPFDDDYIPNLFKKINGGIFTLPSFLSPPVRELVSAMLIVDPIKRITIPEIRRLAWFNVDLPDYLQSRPETPQASLTMVDEGIIDSLVKKMGFSKETIRYALKEPGNNQIKVAYQLVVDHIQMMADGKLAKNANMKGFLSSSPPAWNLPESKETQAALAAVTSGISSASIALGIKPSNGTANSAKPPGQTLQLAKSSIQIIDSTVPKPDPRRDDADQRRGKTRSRWHYGIRSRSDPLDIMLEIYRAVNNVGMKWKTINPFKIRCIHMTTRGQNVKVDVQLFKMDNNSYLVDFRNIVGGAEVDDEDHESVNHCDTVFAFFDACTKLITELAISS